MATTQASLSLKTLLVPSKTVNLEFPGFPGFKIDVSFLSRETLINIRKKASKTSYKNRQASEELDDELELLLPPAPLFSASFAISGAVRVLL